MKQSLLITDAVAVAAVPFPFSVEITIDVSKIVKKNIYKFIYIVVTIGRSRIYFDGQFRRVISE